MTEIIHFDKVLDEARKALARFYRTPDGAALFTYLHQQVMRVPASASEPCALSEDNGRRRFALELLNAKDADLKPDDAKPRSRRRIT